MTKLTSAGIAGAAQALAETIRDIRAGYHPGWRDRRRMTPDDVARLLIWTEDAARRVVEHLDQLPCARR